MIDLNSPVQDASAQDLVCALMLLHRERDLMEQITLDLAARPQIWDSFVLGPALPAIEYESYRGIFSCVRDLGLGLTADTLYVKSPDRSAAEIVRAMAHRWQCTQITTFSAEHTTYLMGCPGILSAIRWQQLVQPSRSDYDTLYANKSMTWLNRSQSIGQCSAQAIVAALMRRTRCEDFDPEIVFAALADNTSMWRSFVMGPELTEEGTSLQGCLKVLSSLPSHWSGNCLYLWSWDNADAVLLQELSHRWQCSAVSVFDETETARLLNVNNDGLLVMYEWDAEPRELLINSML